MTRRALPGLMALPLLVLGLLAAPAGAATSENCSGALSSVDGQGATVGMVTVPGPDGTEARPFRLLWGDPVTWTGQTARPVTTGTWHLTVADPSWLFALGQTLAGHPHGLSGTFESGQGSQSFTNTFTASDIEPVTLPGVYTVHVAVTGDGGVDCTAALVVKVTDSPFRNPMFWLAALMAVAGLVLLFAFGVTKVTRPVVERPGGPVR